MHLRRFEPDYVQEFFTLVDQLRRRQAVGVLVDEIVKNRRVTIKELDQLETWDDNYKIIQFWDNCRVPGDVQRFIDTWARAAPHGGHVLFDDRLARSFVAAHYPSQFTDAYDRCFHPAMKSDYFRLAYLYVFGGVYADADEELLNDLPRIDFSRGDFLVLHSAVRLREPDGTGAKVWTTVRELEAKGASTEGLQCFLRNAFLVATPANPIIYAALQRATMKILEAAHLGEPIDIQESTGPGNLTLAVVAHLIQKACCGARGVNVRILHENLRATRYCGYKASRRNWRHDEQQIQVPKR